MGTARREAGRVNSTEPRVRFADGFDNPERIAFGLAAPQLVAVVVGSLVGWSLLHGPAPTALRVPVVVLVAAVTAVLGWGRWEERPLLTWAWLAARFLLLPRAGGGAQTLLAQESTPTNVGTGPTGADASGVGAANGDAPRVERVAEAAPPAWGDEPRAPASVPAAIPTPAWGRWVAEPSPVEPPEGAEEAGPPLPAPVSTAGASLAPAPARPRPGAAPTHALIVGRLHTRDRAPVPPPTAAPERTGVVLLPTPAAPAASAPAAPTAAAPTLAPVLQLRAASAPPWGVVGGALELGDRGEPGPDPVPLRVPPRARRVAFFALSGGSGRTTLAAETAGVLAAEGHRVALLDLDQRAPGVAVRLGLPQPARWDPVLLGGDRIERLDDLLVTHGSGLRALVGPPRTVGGDTGMAAARVPELLHLLDGAGAELVVLDVAGDLSALTTVALSAADDVYVVVTPTARGVQDAYCSTEALRRIGLGPALHYVVNRVRGEPDLGEVMGDLGGRVVASIPYDAHLEAAEGSGRVATLDPGGASAPALRELAATVLGATAGRRNRSPAR